MPIKHNFYLLLLDDWCVLLNISLSFSPVLLIVNLISERGYRVLTFHKSISSSKSDGHFHFVVKINEQTIIVLNTKAFILVWISVKISSISLLEISKRQQAVKSATQQYCCTQPIAELAIHICTVDSATISIRKCCWISCYQ